MTSNFTFTCTCDDNGVITLEWKNLPLTSTFIASNGLKIKSYCVNNLWYNGGKYILLQSHGGTVSDSKFHHKNRAKLRCEKINQALNEIKQQYDLKETEEATEDYATT